MIGSGRGILGVGQVTGGEQVKQGTHRDVGLLLWGRCVLLGWGVGRATCVQMHPASGRATAGRAGRAPPGKPC